MFGHALVTLVKCVLTYMGNSHDVSGHALVIPQTCPNMFGLGNSQLFGHALVIPIVDTRVGINNTLYFTMLYLCRRCLKGEYLNGIYNAGFGNLCMVGI